MSEGVCAGQLFERLEQRLGLAWPAGEAGRGRLLVGAESPDRRPSHAGFLNLVHPNHVQVLGAEELKYLDALDARKRWETVAEILADRPVALIVCDGLAVPDDLLSGAEESATPVWTTALRGLEVLGHVQHLLTRDLAACVTLHGVFIEVFSIGVLITGDSGAGKSELALELITRGHRLIADDAPLMTLIAPDVIEGTCPAILQDCLEVRGLGILDVRAMFGDSAIKPSKYLRLVVRLGYGADAAAPEATLDRLRGDRREREILGVAIPEVVIPVAPGRNMAVILEAAVRNEALKLGGYDAAEAFLRRHEAFLAEQQV